MPTHKLHQTQIFPRQVIAIRKREWDPAFKVSEKV